MVKQYLYYPAVSSELHIPEIVDLMKFQEINNCLKVSTYYNEDLIHIFYVGLQSSEGWTFRFQMGKHSYHFMEDTWREVFGLYMFSHYSTFFYHSFHPNFDLRGYLNSCLKATRPEDNLAKVSTGYLKRNLCILHWSVTHMLGPRKGGHSRIDIVEVHIMYLLQHKVPLNWPNYFVSRMFVFKECNKGSFLCYVSMIAKILKPFCVSVPNLHNISPGQA